MNCEYVVTALNVHLVANSKFIEWRHWHAFCHQYDVRHGAFVIYLIERTSQQRHRQFHRIGRLVCTLSPMPMVASSTYCYCFRLIRAKSRAHSFCSHLFFPPPFPSWYCFCFAACFRCAATPIKHRTEQRVCNHTSKWTTNRTSTTIHQHLYHDFEGSRDIFEIYD